MIDTTAALKSLTEDELDTLVSIAIHRAEVLEEVQSPSANDAWYEVMVYEEQLATITRPEEISGGVARVGAVTAALAAGRRSEASRLAARYLAEDQLPSERRAAIQRALREERERLVRRFPALAKNMVDHPWLKAVLSLAVVAVSLYVILAREHDEWAVGAIAFVLGYYLRGRREHAPL